jgi:hypothetical protein
MSDCAVCWPRQVPCEGECDGEREATHDVVVGRSMVYPAPMPTRPLMPPPEVIERTKPMCHSCAVKERAEKDAGHADD